MSVQIAPEETETERLVRRLAACSDGTGQLTALFFSDDTYDIAKAKHICGTCPVRSECLAGALERREPLGVWGGELFSDGHVIAYKRRRGRPPKHRAAEYLVVGGTQVLVTPEVRGPVTQSA